MYFKDYRFKLLRSFGFRFNPGVAFGLVTHNHNGRDSADWIANEERWQEEELVTYQVKHSFYLPLMEFAVMTTYIEYNSEEMLNGYLEDLADAMAELYNKDNEGK